MIETVLLDAIVWDPSIYPRAKWSTATIDRYVDALEAGDEFPPIIVEYHGEKLRLLDGKHRLEAHKKAERETVEVERRSVPEGMTTKHYAAILSARHGDRMSNADLKALAREDFEANPTRSPVDWGRDFGVPERTVRFWVSDIIDRERRRRQAAVWRLAKLGWTQQEIADRFGVKQPQVSKDIHSGNLADLHTRLPEDWNDRGLADEAERTGVPLTEAMAAAISGMDDAARLAKLDIRLQPYDVWQFPSCHDLMGDRHPGRIPGELVCHALYFYTKPGDLVVDPMAGSGTTLDACLLMGRKARGYDIDHRHDRVDVEAHDLSTGWPDTVEKASLIFWDPPYFNKMDHSTIGDDGYIEGSISGLNPDGYLDWLTDRFADLAKRVKPGTRLTFLMSDWDPEGAKNYSDHPGIFVWDYADRLRSTGWQLRRHIQTPLSTQQVQPWTVDNYRETRRLARLERYLLVAEA